MGDMVVLQPDSPVVEMLTDLGDLVAPFPRPIPFHPPLLVGSNRTRQGEEAEGDVSINVDFG